MGEFRADRIGKSDVGHDAFAEKRIHAMAGTIEELIGDYEIQRLVLFLQRSDRGNGNDPFDAELFESVNVGAEIQFGRQNAMPASVPSQECDLAAFERTENIGIGRISEWSLLFYLAHLGKAGHGIEPAAADNANFCLRQESPKDYQFQLSGIRIIQKNSRGY